ncbi:hypothetical protein AHAS_Ahas20G0124700 [Arachis hypogaea]
MCDKIGDFFNDIMNEWTKLYSELEAISILVLIFGGLSDECRGCLGALDGTYMDVTVPEEDKSRYEQEIVKYQPTS